MVTDVSKWILLGLVLLVGGCEQSAPPPPAVPAGDAQTGGRPEAGKALFIKQECLNCHSLKGEGGSQGPDLTQVTLRRSREWLTDFIYVPSEKFPDATMPQVDWGSEQEVADVVAFLESLKREVPVEQIFAAKLGPVKTGEALVEAYDCRACHTIGEGGIAGYPDLTYVGSKIRPEWEAHWLKDPQQVKPGTFMPTFTLGEREIEAIVAYLASLQWDRPPGGPQ